MFGASYYNMSRQEAEAQLALYAELPELTERERRMLDIYDAIVKGEKFIELTNVLKHAYATSPTRLPDLTLAPIPATQVTYERRWKRAKGGRREGVFEYRTEGWSLRLPPHFIDKYDTHRTTVATALAPSIPPVHREKVKPGDLLIWEPSWRLEKESVQIPRDPDPAIIRQVNNGIYLVVAAWNMTPVEAQLLAE